MCKTVVAVCLVNSIEVSLGIVEMKRGPQTSGRRAGATKGPTPRFPGAAFSGEADVACDQGIHDRRVGQRRHMAGAEEARRRRQIGRAPSRKRGCKQVQIWGADVTSKKKHI